MFTKQPAFRCLEKHWQVAGDDKGVFMMLNKLQNDNEREIRHRNSYIPTIHMATPIIMSECTAINNNTVSLNDLQSFKKINENELRPDHLLFLKILLLNNSRFSEIHSIMTSDIISGSRIIIKGKKSGASSIIYMFGIEKLASICNSCGFLYIFPFISYMQMRSVFMKLNILNINQGKKYNTRTHTARKLIDIVTNGSLNDRDLSDILHQRNKKNSSYYRKIKNKNNMINSKKNKCDTINRKEKLK